MAQPLTPHKPLTTADSLIPPGSSRSPTSTLLCVEFVRLKDSTVSYWSPGAIARVLSHCFVPRSQIGERGTRGSAMSYSFFLFREYERVWGRSPAWPWQGMALPTSSLHFNSGELNGIARRRVRYHFTDLPISRGQTFVRGKSCSSFESSSGLPVSAGKVPKCIGITCLALSRRHARAASRGPIV